ncbi:Microbial collagenase [hydrothermal vent metagenome]|uniref:Microbial collagenase n=1 Tax=hydrothermal vent metagenome TaxID=652676 RepID=A0A3B0VSD5_9ZZZZ
MKRQKAILKNRLNRLDIFKARKLANIEKKHYPPSKQLPEKHSGFIIVRLSEILPLPSNGATTLSAVAKELRLKGLEKILDQFDLSITRRLIRSMKPKKILELERIASKSELPPINSLTMYWRVDVRDQVDQIEEILKYFNNLNEIDLAYKELTVSDPIVNAADDPYNGNQGYLDPAPIGINARWAWTQPNGEGAGIGFIDLEQGWFPNHEDFTSKSPTIIYGDNRDGVGSYKGNHGTAVLGQVIADDNSVGVVGIAPSVSSVRMTSHYDSATGTALNVADAILAVIPSMDVGDSLLLEVQRSFLPTETDDADFDAIRLAVAHGIVVVEAAGNGNANLDTYADALGDNILNRGGADFRESGAIIVGASESALPHNRASFSNFGSRIDCYGWGENVVSCGYGDLDAGTGDNSSYTDTFGGTSSASPIVTGAAILLQGMYEANTGTRLSPLQMRALLSDPTTGTAQGGGVAGNIGVMPDLQAIIGTTLDIVPDIYLRDNIGDTGAVPYTGSISASPDIIVRPSLVANPQLEFGQGSGTENSNSLGYEVEEGQDNYIYARMKNRGGIDANNVTTTIYWSEVSTLVTPDMWNLVGTTLPVNVPQGDTIVVADPITWSSGDIPATGHYCFVGIIDHPSDPAPPLPGPTDWNGFRGFIRNHNNVTWRNFNVVNIDPNIVEDPVEMPFIIAGAPDRPREFDIEILQNLGKGAQVWLEVPIGIAKQFFEGRRWKYKINHKKQTVKLLLPATPRIYLPEMHFGKAARINARFIIKGIKKNVHRGNRIAIRQLFKEEEVGRVTWLFHDRRDDKKEC